MKRIFTLFLLVTVALHGHTQKKENKEDKPKANALSGLSFRSLGPAFVSGRIIDLAVNPRNHDEFYVAAASGGVWKTTNHGNTFSPVFDEQSSYSIGCVVIDPNNPHTLWVGTGENNNQRSVAYGDGIYRSVDDGKTWKNMGLKNSEHISRILVHPGNSDIVYVAAYGPLWNDGGERGIYKTTDGGNTWERILHVSDKTGFSDLWMDPRDPRIMYAAAHQRRRHVWTYLGGGPESAVYKTTDGGKNWRKIMAGLPKDTDLGRIALAVSPANPDIVYAMVEGYDKEHGGFYRSTNMGEHWERRSDYFTSGNYYVELIPDPENADRVFSMDTWLHHTDDGGKTFRKTGEEGKHVDNHAMWVDPANTRHWLVGCDGGLYETWDAAANWKFHQNLPITQFYRVAVDYDTPFYNIYGGTQDNNTLGGPSRTINTHGIGNSDWFVTRGGDGFEPQVDPQDPNIVYSQAQYGWLVRFNRKTGERVNIKPIEQKGDAAYRWNWDAPLIISPHNNKRLYFAANRVFRSDDRGETWEVISDDLTQKIDRNTLKVMGTTWGPDAVAYHQSTSVYGNIVVLAESPAQEGLLYAGTDDGLIYVTENNGGNWTRMNSFPGVPERTYVADIYPDRFDANTVYAAFNNHKNGDFKPYLLRSNDKGRTWTPIAGGLPERGSVYCIEQDHEEQSLLFAGTEFGVFFSAPGNKGWTGIKGGLPVISIRDMEIQRRENDLVLASFGRGFYVLDDYTALRHVADTAGKSAMIFPVKDALIFNEANPLGTRGKGSQGEAFFTTPNPPVGAVFTYYIKSKPTTLAEQRQTNEKKIRAAGGDISYPGFPELKAEDLEEKPFLIFEIRDARGNVVNRYRETKVNKGINRSHWDFRAPTTSPVKLKTPETGPYDNPDWGALVLPGAYSVTIHQFVNGKLEQIAGPQNFNVKLLHDKQISRAADEELTNFIRQVSDARRIMLAANEDLKALGTRLKYMQHAVLQTPGADPKWLEDIDALRRELTDIQYAFSGDATRAKREIETYPGLLSRVELISDNIYNHTESPTVSEKRSLDTALAEFEDQRLKLETLRKRADAFTENLRKAGSPYFPE